MSNQRQYDDPCGVARALDLIGERWALLVVRELLFGPKRFADLRAGLPRLSQNVLTTRLRELGRDAIVRRRKLGPPAGSWAYELTELGRELHPVLVQLARWGSRTALTSNGELSVDALMLALQTTFDAHAAEGLNARYELRLGDDVFRVEIADGDIEVARGAAADPLAIIEASAPTLRSLVFGGRDLSEAVSAGDVRLAGDAEAAALFLRLFPRPTPVSG